MKSLQRGFNLVEVITVLAILAIFAGIAMPALNEFISNTRLSSQANDLMTDVALARSEAARTNRRVSICASADFATCSTSATQWNIGWIIFSDANSDGAVTIADNDEILRTRSQLSGDSSLVSSGFPTLGRFQLRPSGAVDSAGNFLLCQSSRSGHYGKLVSINPNGSVRIQREQSCP